MSERTDGWIFSGMAYAIAMLIILGAYTLYEHGAKLWSSAPVTSEITAETCGPVEANLLEEFISIRDFGLCQGKPQCIGVNANWDGMSHFSRASFCHLSAVCRTAVGKDIAITQVGKGIVARCTGTGDYEE